MSCNHKQKLRFPNRQCKSCYKLAWRKRNPIKRKEQAAREHRKKEYGMEQAHFDTLLFEQRGRCAICQSLLSDAVCVVDLSQNQGSSRPVVLNVQPRARLLLRQPDRIVPCGQVHCEELAPMSNKAFSESDRLFWQGRQLRQDDADGDNDGDTMDKGEAHSMKAFEATRHAHTTDDKDSHAMASKAHKEAAAHYDAGSYMAEEHKRMAAHHDEMC